jgi:predicted ATPase
LPLAPLVKNESFGRLLARVLQTHPSFIPDDAVSILALFRLLGGLPLAIELAAARGRLVAPQTLLKRIGQRCNLLASKDGHCTR